MAWVLLTVTVVLAVVVLALLALVVRLTRRVATLETGSPSRRGSWSGSEPEDSHLPHLDEDRAEFVITRVGEPEPVPQPEPVATVAAPVFADLVLKETVVQTASLFQGLRRALSPETRNRIRFHMRQEVKRSRKQRRAELKEVRREWAARQRAAMPADETVGRAEGTAA
jgi:hypothetical protein